ncbi:hypothetical protein [Peribacillus sp. Hz7]|uniref:hypothetical protein n=1 Tax=Peribacillus sp. Hz7 TaxID=3344873 RepID=UPI0035CC783B
MSELLKYCSNILQELEILNIDLSTSEEDSNEMYFDINERKIYINERRLREEARAYLIPFNLYVKIIFLHELGHAQDKNLEAIHDDSNSCFERAKENPFSNRVDELLLRIKGNSIQAEKNAWEIAEGFIDDELKNAFNLIKKNSLKEHEIDALLNMKKIKLEIKEAKLQSVLEQKEIKLAGLGKKASDI